MARRLHLAIFIGDSDPNRDIETLASSFDSDPSVEHLRALLNYPASASLSYKKMALVGAAFAGHPDVFHAVSMDLKTDEEESSILLLATYGQGGFEYFPERKPLNFDRQLAAQKWLMDIADEQGTVLDR